MKTITFTLAQRIILMPKLMPTTGSLIKVVTVKALRHKLEIKQSELVEFGISENKEKGTISWNEAGVKARFDVELTDLEQSELKNILNDLDNEGQINEELITLFEACK